MGSPGVPHGRPSDDTYLGWVELTVRDEGVVGDLLAEPSADGLAEHVAAIHAYPVREIYTIISAGRPTEVGLRGYPAVRTMNAVGAGAQHGEAVLSLLFGDAVLGPDRLRGRT